MMLEVLAGIRIPRTGPGRPRTRSTAVLADRADATGPIRKHLRARGIKTVIPEKKDSGAAHECRGSAEGRPPALDVELHKQRNVVERQNVSQVLAEPRSWHVVAGG